MIVCAEVHDIEVGVKVGMVRGWMMCRRVVHGELKRRKNRNWFSNPKRVEGSEHVGERNVVMDLNSFVALPSS